MGSRPWLHHAAPVGAESQLAISCRPGDMGNMTPSTCRLFFEGDARRREARGVPRCLQPLQGWLTFVGPVPVAARGLATGYFLPALRAESHKSPPVIRTTSAQGLV